MSLKRNMIIRNIIMKSGDIGGGGGGETIENEGCVFPPSFLSKQCL